VRPVYFILWRAFLAWFLFFLGGEKGSKRLDGQMRPSWPAQRVSEKKRYTIDPPSFEKPRSSRAKIFQERRARFCNSCPYSFLTSDYF